MTATASNLPNGRKTYLDQNGEPLAGGQVFFYTPGTTTPVVVYLDDAMTIAATSPIILDAAGSCVAFAVGEIREYVLDALNNVISDSVVVAPTPLFISPAMLPVLEATTVAQAEALLVQGSGGFTNLQIDPGDMTLNVSPTGNSPSTRATFSVQGTTLNPNSREFMANMGMTSSVGSGGTAGNDKVTLYTGMDAQAGTADVWSVNTLLTMEANSGSYNAQGIEADFNNFNANLGASGLLGADFTAPIAIGLSLSGAGSFSSSAALFINSVNQNPNNEPQWNRGIVTAGHIGLCAIQEWSTTPVGLQFDGAYSVAAINLVSVHGNVGAVTGTALFMKNAQTLSWQSADTGHVISDVVDVANNRIVGLSSGAISNVYLAGPTLPLTNNLTLGSATNFWGDFWGTNIRLANTGVISWQNNPANNGGIAALVFDYVDNVNNRVIGDGAQTVYMGATTAPQTPNFDLGTSTNAWGNVYSTNGIVAPSDIVLKENVTPLSDAVWSAVEAVEMIEPIAFTWKDHRDDKAHFGFNADDIRSTFSADCGAYHEEDGQKFICKDELVAVLWQAVRELSDRIKRLEVH